MRNEDYPALFRRADKSSRNFQSAYLNLIKVEYCLLFIASVLSMSVFVGVEISLVSAFVFACSSVVLVARSNGKPEQNWYKSRALAESVKTLTWRYMMRAQPFVSGTDGIGHRLEFKQNLAKLFDSHGEVSAKLDESDAISTQITPEMERVRGLDLSSRKKYYEENRIEEQQRWYANKAMWNRRMSRHWRNVSIAAYIVAAILSLARVEFTEWGIWPIEPIIVVASSVLGWVQIKKFNELSTAYAVTAHEIGLIHMTLEPATTEESLSVFTTEAELAFSREHTFWIARQAN